MVRHNPVLRMLLLLQLDLVVLFLPVADAIAAPGDTVFSMGFPSVSESVATTTPAGAFTVSGTFFGSVDFGGGTLTSGGLFTPDVFVAHWDASGTHQWSFNVTHNNGFGGVFVRAIAADTSGNLYLGGRIADGDIDFGGGTLVAATADLFLLGLGPAGAHLWSRVVAGDFGGSGTVVSVVPRIDLGADLVVSGEMRGSVDFGGGSFASNGLSDFYVAAYDPSSGTHQWSNHWGDSTNEIPHDVSVGTTGNITVSGSMSGSFDAGGGPLPYNANTDLFVASYDASGSHLWSRGFGTASIETFSGNVVDASGAVLLFGRAGAGIDFGKGPLSDADLYLARLEGQGGGPSVPALGPVGLAILFGVVSVGGALFSLRFRSA